VIFHALLNLMACYSGPNPIGKLSDSERLAMWKWVKENAIDRGMPFEQVHDTLNSHFFGGAAKPEWVNEFLAARKTPFKRASDAVWTAQANRRNIQQQAKNLLSDRNANILERAAKAVIAGPRYVTVGGGLHGVVFPGTHGGALALNPLRWRSFARLVVNTWKNLNPTQAKILADNMARSPYFALGRRLGVDLTTHGMETGGGRVSARTWGALLETRFRLFEAAMKRHIDSGKYSAAEIDSIGKQLAVWANHATGSGKGPITAHPVIAQAFFGPKLAQSYWNRLVGDPVKTIGTFTNWNKADAGDKVVAMQRLRGALSMAVTYSGMLMANQALLAATGQKDQINWNDPTKSDWLGFKGFGFRWSLPGAMHSEINLIGQIIAAQSMKPDQLAAVGIPVPKGKVSEDKLSSLRQLYVGRQLFDYAQNKATPAIGLARDIVTGHDFMGRPLPWVSEKQTPKEAQKHPPVSWGEYAWSHAPIPLAGAARYVYDELRKAGSSAGDAMTWIRAAMVGGVNAVTGIDPKEIKEPIPMQLQQAVRQQRAAAALQRR
jgi:hypothetical protein